MRSTSRIGLTVLALLSVSCGADAPEEIEEPSIPDPPPALTRVADIRSPILASAPTPEELAVIANASQISAIDCAARFGVTYEPDLSASTLTSLSDVVVSRYGVIDREWVTQRGHQPQLVATDSDTIVWNPTRFESEVIQGTDADGVPSKLLDEKGDPMPEHGCSGEGFRKIAGDSPDPEALLREGLNETQARTAGDSRVVRAEKEWVTCMRGKGYTGENREAIYEESLPEEGDNIELALANVDCAQAVNLPGISYAVDLAYQERWVKRHAAEVNETRAGFDAALGRARDVLAGR